jgi:type II secretory pathway component GspD/PulD (secretin)
MVSDNQAILIGGLIQETSSDQQSKLPILGNLPVVGRLFQHRTRVKARSEIIVALLPRIVPYDGVYAEKESFEVMRTQTPP